MMKKILGSIAVITLVALAAKKCSRLPLIGDKAPKFKAKSTQGKINFPSQYKGKWVVFFSHPGDFTPVCTTEFMMFQKMYDEFKSMNSELVGLSVDTLASHMAWLKNIKEEVFYNGISGVDIEFPLIEDSNKKIAQKYGMLQPKSSNTSTVRAVFIIDPKGIIRSILYYPSTSGRNLNEIKRLLVSLQAGDEFNVATPANWVPGEDAIMSPQDFKILNEKNEKNNELHCSPWYLCFTNLPKETIKEKLIKDKEYDLN